MSAQGKDPPVLNCPGRGFYACPKKWGDLKIMDHPDVRFCKFCQSSVFLCHDQKTLDRRVERGDCVCFVTRKKSEKMDFVVVGRPSGSESEYIVIDRKKSPREDDPED